MALLTPRERMEALVQPGSLLELGAEARSQQPSVADCTPADGTYTAWAKVAGEEVAIVAEDPGVLALTDGEVARRKRHRILKLALHARRPIVLLIAGSPAAPPPFDANTGELSGRMSDPRDDVDLSRRSSPLVSVLFGSVVGWAREMLVESDVVVATRSAYAELSPDARSSVDVVTPDDAAAVAATTQVVELLVGRDPDAARVRFGVDGDRPSPEAPSPEALMREPLRVIDLLVDDASFLAFHSAQSSGLYTGLARIGGWPVVVAATGGAESALLSPTDLRRLRRAYRLGGRESLPLVILQDCAGFDADADGDLEAIGALVAEIRRADGPVISVVTGQGHTLGTFPLGTKQLGAAFIAAWPWSCLSTTDAVSYAGDALDMVREPSPWLAAGRGLVDDVLTPSETRHTVRQLVALFGEHWRTSVPEHRPNAGPDCGIG